MRDIIVLLISMILIITAITSRFAGAVGYWWFGIFRPQDWVWGNINSLKLPLIAIALFVIPCFLQGLWPRFKDPISKLLLFYLVLTILTQVTSSCMPIGFRAGYFQQFCVLLLAIFLTIRVTDSEQRFWLITRVSFWESRLARYVGHGRYLLRCLDYAGLVCRQQRFCIWFCSITIL